MDRALKDIVSYIREKADHFSVLYEYDFDIDKMVSLANDIKEKAEKLASFVQDIDDNRIKEPDYKNMSPGDLIDLMGVNGMKWAKAFMAITKDKVLNEDEMMGWFANAIEAGKDYKRIGQSQK